ncbi:MAG: HNH endonuclease [Paludibacteraceae bacterium]|nr:HNH endonuclease [Paludibacteraceae bacterium]
MELIDAAAKLKSVRGYECNRMSTIIIKYYGDNGGLPLGFGLDELCKKLKELGVSYSKIGVKDGDFILYVDGSEKTDDKTLNVSASAAPRTPGEGKWEEKDDGTYEWIPKNKNSKPEDDGTWCKGKDCYYWKPGTSEKAIPGYPKDNTQCWNDILKNAIMNVNEYRNAKGKAPLPDPDPFKGFPFGGNPPDLNVDLSEYVYGEPITLDIYSSDRTFNFFVAERMYSQKKGDPKKYTPSKVRKYMKKNKLTWHESEDGRTLMKVPTVIHQNVPHNGGVNAVKREGVSTFDSNTDVILSNKVRNKHGKGGKNESKI